MYIHTYIPLREWRGVVGILITQTLHDAIDLLVGGAIRVESNGIDVPNR